MLAISAIALAALAEPIIALSSIPATAKEYSLRPSPNGTNCLANDDKSSLPVNRLNNPPVLGIASDRAARALAALAEAFIAAGSTPAITSLYAFILSPNGTNCSPNLVNGSLPIVKKSAILVTKPAPVIANTALTKLPTFVEIEGSILLAPLTNGCIFSMKSDKSSAISGREFVKP